MVNWQKKCTNYFNVMKDFKKTHLRMIIITSLAHFIGSILTRPLIYFKTIDLKPSKITFCKIQDELFLQFVTVCSSRDCSFELSHTHISSLMSMPQCALISNPKYSSPKWFCRLPIPGVWKARNSNQVFISQGNTQHFSKAYRLQTDPWADPKSLV